jgi:hypothetical protein
MKAKSKPPRKIGQQVEQHVHLRIIFVSPPNADDYGATFGIQDNSTTKEWVIHKGKSLPKGDVQFECECRVRRNHATGNPNFLGPFVHGGTGDRILYLSWRPKDWHPGGPAVPRSTWLRRMKIRLGSITWPQIEQAVHENGVLEIKVAGTGSAFTGGSWFAIPPAVTSCSRAFA